MFKFLLLTTVSAFETTEQLTIEKCTEINNDLIHLTFPFTPKNMSLINTNNIFCDSKYQPKTVYVTSIDENIMYFPSVYTDNNVSLRYFYDCSLLNNNCDVMILNIDNSVVYHDLKISIFFYLTLACIVFSAIIVSVLLYVLPMTIMCCKSSEYMINQLKEGILYQFAFIGILCIYVFFDKYFEYVKNKYLYSSNIYDYIKIYYGINLN